jgi:hypothetical protein
MSFNKLDLHFYVFSTRSWKIEAIPADSPLAAALSCSSLCLRTRTSPRSYREHFVRMIQNCFPDLNGRSCEHRETWQVIDAARSEACAKAKASRWLPRRRRRMIVAPR